MRNLILALTAAMAALPLSAQTMTEWTNPEINALNREPMHAWFFAYESEDAAATGIKEASANFLSLNGNWRFNWVADADMRPTDFFTPEYDDNSWDRMPVPALWELNGYGDPVYKNIGYAWAGNYENNPPFAPVKDNHVGSYRRKIIIPESWNGRQIIAHFGSVTSNIYLWVNGKFVGYSEDSKLEAEFDVTKYLRAGENLFAFQTFRWCDGTYLEDQDFWRLSGVGRDCWLESHDAAARLKDVRTVVDLDADYRDATLTVNLSLSGGATANLKLTDANGVEIAAATDVKKSHTFAIENPKKWSAECPNLYRLTVSVCKRGEPIETVPLNVGFRKIEITGSQVLVNGQSVLFKGADRHEMDPDGGYVVSTERMIQDIAIMKRYNINAVRTCHYPDSNEWYDLCDRYGLYVVAEANLESHGMGYGDKTLARVKKFAKAHMERNQRNVQRNFNHPSIIFWSLGNEAGFGKNFETCYRWVKAEDPSRPVQYERAGKNDFTDIFCPMYYTYEKCKKYCESDAPENAKPLIQCEYAHAMGNSEGGFAEYWELIRKYPKYQGGFIWDFVDQGLHGVGTNGKTIYAYAGDYNTHDPNSDQNFNCNGLINPDRIPNPHAEEVGYFQQNIWATPVDLASGRIEIYNENFFRPTDYCRLQWTLLKNGTAVQSGVADIDGIAPQQRKEITLPYTVTDADEDVLLNIEFIQKAAEPLIAAGTVVARAQMTVREYVPQELSLSSQINANCPTDEPAVNEVNGVMTVSGVDFSIEFSKTDGFIHGYKVGGMQIIAEGGALTPNFWRAPTDNDFGAGLQKRYSAWRNPEMKLVSLASGNAGSNVVVTARYDMPQVLATLDMTYTVSPFGEILVSQKLTVTPGANVSDMFRFGMRFRMPYEAEVSTFYGRGPVENYADRKASQFFGIYSQTADEQAYGYVRPQETGTKSDMRWWRQTYASGRGVMITSVKPFYASALHYSMESLDDGDEKDQRHFAEVEKSAYTNVTLDGEHMGLGCVNSWGAMPIDKYLVRYADKEFTFLLTPLK